MKRTLLFGQAIEKIREYPGIGLFLLNLILGILLLLVRDPFGKFQNTYANADPFFEIDPERIQTIISGRKGQESVLNRDLDGWTVRLGKDTKAPGDKARIEELIHTCLSMRRFTLLSDSNSHPSPLEEFGLDGDEPVLEFKDVSGNSLGKILLGARAPKASGTYVMDEKNRIWLVKENLKLVTGAGKQDFFISRNLIPDFPSRELVLEVSVTSASRNEGFVLLADGENWIVKVSGQEIQANPEEVETFIQAIKKLNADEVLLDRTEEIRPLPPKQNFKIEIKTSTDHYTIHPIGVTKLGSFIFQKKDLEYKLVLDPWNLEPILQKDLSEFTTRTLPTNKGF
ncbi:DUF4340 domain-containing protein [Leptospira langatensis]|uniref:DUF4340 domain-containing protein n=1 Tax=Leptospira langatensis TaxID=2484983 RepID=A0A5F1ZNU8_9LEPT|nr:DUF4340 domain-containing protein [Leptospira langatensis]TGK05552.1 DUF4340 domain-containing protein [Leptospira langatensis]TGL38684.1 DUF4340 domain-containing protein [Leptospira langatensis]